MVKTRNVQTRQTERRLRHGIAVQLMMECMEEELSPVQIKCQKDQALHYHKAMEKIRDAHQLARSGKAYVTTSDDTRKAVPQAQNVPKQTPPKGALVSQINSTQKQAFGPERSTSPDVIFVSESPPKAKPNPAPPQPQSPARAPPQPPRPTVQQPIPNQPSTASPTVYQFVSLNSNSPRNQILMRPVKTPPLQSFPGHRGPVPARIIPHVPNTRMPPRLIQMPQMASVTTPVAGTFGMGIKRSVEDPNKMALAKKKRIETDESGNWVPLDEYYYGKMEGDPGYTEEKGEYRFKCWSCSKMLYNNTKAMMHIQGHIDSSKQQNIDLSDLTQCKHCYKQFDTPFEMQTHVEKVHMNNVNVLMCRICERDHESRQSLTNHMRQNHNSCEMPYICQLCKFRSSMYSDVVDHFKKKHDSSQHLLCLYCLKVFNVKFVSQGWGQTQTYYGHLLKHQSKTSSKKCQLCRLTFFNPQDVKQHRKRDHTPNHKGIGSNARYTTPGQLMIKVPESGIQGKQNVKSLNAPAVSKVLDFGGTRFPSAVHVLHCIECKMVMGTPDHYKKYVECSMCRFATSCSIAYANHMMGFHSGQMSSLNLNIPWERPMETTMYCLCGFGSRYGNKIANHLVYCTKQSCYKTRPTTLADDGDEEEKDPRHKPGASLLDVLGLVKKRTVTTKDTLLDDEVRRSSEESQELVWKSCLDAESCVPGEEESSGKKEDEIPPQYKGPRKWSTVRITDQKTPTKASVFLGAEVTEKKLAEKSEFSKVTEKGDNSESKIEEQKKESGKPQEIDSSGKGGTDHKLLEADSSDKGGNLGIKKESETKGEEKSQSDAVSASEILETKVKKEPTEDIKEEKIVEKSVEEKENSASSSSTLIGKDKTKKESNSNTTEAQESSKSGGVPDVHVKHSEEDDSKRKGDPDCNTNDESESQVSTSAIKVEESVKEDLDQGQTEEVPMETDSSICEVTKKEENKDSQVEIMDTEESSKELSTETKEQSQSENRVNENPVGDLESQSGQISQDNTKSEMENVTEYSKSEESEADVTCSERTKKGSGDGECMVKESITMETESVTDKGDNCEKGQENAIPTKSEKSAISGESDVDSSGNLAKVEDSVDQKSAESSETSAKGDNSVDQKSAESSETSAKGDNSVDQKSAESSETSAKGDNSVHQKSAESSETSAKGDNSVHQKPAESSETSAKGDNSVHQKSAESSETSAKGDNSVHQKPAESSGSMTKGGNSVGQKSDHSESKSRNVDDHRTESRAPSEREQRDHGKPSERDRGRESSGDRHHGYHGNKQDHHRDRDRHHSDKYHGQHRYNDDRRSHDHHHHGDHRSGDYNRDRHGRFHYDDRNNYTRDYHDNRDNRGNRQQGGYHGNHRGPYRGNWEGRGGRGYGYGGYQGNYR